MVGVKIMNQQKVLKLIHHAQRVAEGRLENAPCHRIYSVSSDYLKELYDIVAGKVDANDKEAVSKKLDMFITHEVEPVDIEYAHEVSKATFAFDYYYGLVDPDLLKIMKESGDL